ncbi:MAG: hypothetical protein VB032_07430 [Burkholderiaceae bacterium]|nr:hypothetical protein [Burkholderiaceae bacterium]
MASIKSRWISFGGTAAIVTSTSLIIGMDAAGSGWRSIVSAIAMFAVADNLTDSLSVHIYQESEGLESREAFFSTVANFFARMSVAFTFMAMVITVPRRWLPISAAAWGLLLLVLLTYRLARERAGKPIVKEICKHVWVATAVIGLSRLMGMWIQQMLG